MHDRGGATPTSPWEMKGLGSALWLKFRATKPGTTVSVLDMACCHENADATAIFA